MLEGSDGTPFAGENLLPEVSCLCCLLYFLGLSSILKFSLTGGFYYGKIKFPPEYPYKPPGITYVSMVLQNLPQFVDQFPKNQVFFLFAQNDYTEWSIHDTKENMFVYE